MTPRSMHFELAVLALVALAGASHGETPSTSSAARRLDNLVQRLSHEVYDVRQQASNDLAQLHESYLPLVRRQAALAKDLETRWRLDEAVRAIMLGARTSKSIGLELQLLDNGEFQMGSADGESGRRKDEQLHRVIITQPFLMGKFEVTQAQYARVMRTNPSWFTPTSDGKSKVAKLDTDGFPAERVTWYDAIEFCNKLSEMDGYQPCYTMSNVERKDN